MLKELLNDMSLFVLLKELLNDISLFIFNETQAIYLDLLLKELFLQYIVLEIDQNNTYRFDLLFWSKR